MTGLNTFMSPYREHRAVRLMDEISGWFGASAFVTYAFHLGPLPDLELVHEFPDELYELAGGKEKMEEFRLAMKALAEESNFLDFVRRWQPHYEAWADQAVRGTDLERVERWLTGFSGTSPSEFHVVLSPVLVDMAFGPSVSDKDKGLIPYQTISCTGRAGEPVFASGRGLETLALHELGHSFVNPALAPYAERIDAFSPLAEDVRDQMISEGNGPLPRGFVVENVLRAITSRAEGEIYGARFGKSRIGVHKSRGYYLVGLLTRDFDEYAANRAKYPTFADFVPTLLDRIETYRAMEGTRWRLWMMENWRTSVIVILGAALLVAIVKIQSRWLASQ